MENRTLYVNKRSKTLYAVSILTAALSVFVFYMIFSNLELFLQEFETNVQAIFWTTFMVIMGNNYVSVYVMDEWQICSSRNTVS